MKKSSPKNFTLIELLVVIAIIAILAAMLLPALSQARERGRMSNCTGNIREIGTATMMYLGSFDDFYPPYCPNLNAPNGTWGDPTKGVWASLYCDIGLIKSAGIYFCPSVTDPTAYPACALGGASCVVTKPGEDGGNRYAWKFIQYGYNWKWIGSGGNVGSAGKVTQRASKVNNPSGKIAFAESMYNSNPQYFADGFFTVTPYTFNSEGVLAPRHFSKRIDKGSLNVAFADGHVDNFRNFTTGDHDNDDDIEKYWKIEKIGN